MTRLSASYVHGASDTPLLGLTMGGVLDQAAACHRDALALVSCHQDIRWSWVEFRDQADRVAAGLLALGTGGGNEEDCRLPIANCQLPIERSNNCDRATLPPIGNWQSAIGNSHSDPPRASDPPPPVIMSG